MPVLWAFPEVMSVPSGKHLHLRSCRGQTLGAISLSPVSDKPLITVVLSWSWGLVVVQALVDSGAGSFFIDNSFATVNAISLQIRAIPLALKAIDGRPLQLSQVTIETIPIEMTI